jgi:hypothetical protein
MNYSRAGIGIACDVIIMFLPIPLLLTLHIQRLQKVGAICLFLLGFFTTFCSILRLIQIPTLGKGDPTMFVIWSTAEFNVGVSSNLTPSGALNSRGWFWLTLNSPEYGMQSSISAAGFKDILAKIPVKY